MTIQSRLEKISRHKAQLDTRRPLSASAAARLKAYFDVEWTYHTNAIEGSTLTMRETEALLRHGLPIGGKTRREYLEATNHKHAIDFVESLARGAELPTEIVVQQIHTLILKTIDDDEAGRYRRGLSRISGSAHTPPKPEAVPTLMRDFAQWLTQTALTLPPIESAAHAHLRLVNIHPFTYSNGRTARLLMNLWLLRAGFPPAIISSADRLRYHATLDEAHAGNSQPFVALVTEAVERSLAIALAAQFES
jgi:Fic family protein